jgi:hypothetical protein
VRSRGLSFHYTPMLERILFRLSAVLLACAALVHSNALAADAVAVRRTEGLMHGFLVLRNLQGVTLADGEMAQVAQGDRVTDNLIFRFKDGSVYEDKTTFSQHRKFRLLSDHVVQRGPSFKHPMETSIDASSGQVTVRYKDDDGKEKVLSQRVELPPDVSNGLLFTLVKDVQPNVPRTTVSMVAATPKPRLIKLLIVPQGQEPLSIGKLQHKATHYIVRAEIGGVAGLLAHLLGKQPPDTHVWVLGGDAPTFVKSEGPLYQGGPIWRIQLAAAGQFSKDSQPEN